VAVEVMIVELSTIRMVVLVEPQHLLLVEVTVAILTVQHIAVPVVHNLRVGQVLLIQDIVSCQQVL